MIEIYNDNNSKFPLKGLYPILTKMARTYEFDKSDKNFTDLISFIYKSYGNEFDIKFTFNDGCSHGSTDPILLFRAFWHHDIELCKYLIINHYNESLEQVYDAIHDNMMNQIAGKLMKYGYGHEQEYTDKEMKQYKRFIDDIKEFCLKSVCNNNDECNVLTQSINETWEEFSNWESLW